MATYVRQNVWDLEPWADPILWYARGVKALQQAPLNNPVSWRFYAAIHGINEQIWQHYGYLTPSDRFPDPSVRAEFWDQCQHGTWYFLPWHRGYVLAFEANVRNAIIGLGGPKDWALPYWNYFKAGQNKLPPAFASKGWPVDSGPNPLYVAPRFGPNNDGNVYVDLRYVNLNAMGQPLFTRPDDGGPRGFGGLDTGFSHGGLKHGQLESQPHDVVHGMVGGKGPDGWPGLMATPPAAALDPIFWLHHANIDRLWQSWNVVPPPGYPDPTAPKWLDGPASVGERPFVMPWFDGSARKYTPRQMMDISGLGYMYDDLKPAGAEAAAAARKGIAVGGGGVAGDQSAELLGANDEAVKVTGAANTRVHLHREARRQVAGKLPPRGAGAGEAGDGSERVYLNLDNLTGPMDAATFRVYLGVPDGEDAESYPDRYVDTIAPFGLRQASDPDGEHGGQGLSYVLDATDVVNHLHAEGLFDVDDLPVRLVPANELDDKHAVTVGQISLYHQAQ